VALEFFRRRLVKGLRGFSRRPSDCGNRNQFVRLASVALDG
jgi:hypothetical protein